MKLLDCELSFDMGFRIEVVVVKLRSSGWQASTVTKILTLMDFIFK